MSNQFPAKQTGAEVMLHVMRILWCDHFSIKTNSCREKLACKPRRCTSQNCANSPQNVLQRESNSKLWIVVKILKRRKLPFKVVAGLCISTKAKAKAKKVSKEDLTVLVWIQNLILILVSSICSRSQSCILKIQFGCNVEYFSFSILSQV